MKPCPDRDLLERLLNDRLADTELDELDRHVKGCASCQRSLEELTDDPLWKSELRHEVSRAFGDTDPERRAGRPGVMADGATAADDHTDRVVPTVPGYEIDGELGRGGMGVVYRARHVRLNRPWALIRCQIGSPRRSSMSAVNSLNSRACHARGPDRS